MRWDERKNERKRERESEKKRPVRKEEEVFVLGCYGDRGWSDDGFGCVRLRCESIPAEQGKQMEYTFTSFKQIANEIVLVFI